MTNLFQDVERAVTKIFHGWTSVPKAQSMAAIVVALRPEISVEIGVYAGKGIVSLGLAHKAIGRGLAVGIDPYSAAASVKGQLNIDDVKFWKEEVDYDLIKRACFEAIEEFKVGNFVDIIQRPSDDVMPPRNIGLLRIDGNHGEQAFRDMIRFTPTVILGGLCIIDDLGWTGGHTTRAAKHLSEMGWRELYPLDDGAVFQRIR